MKKIRTININTVFIIIVVFIFLCLIFKLFYVGTGNVKVGTQSLSQFASSRDTVKKTIKASRGTIYSSSKEVLAKDVNSYTVIAYLDSSRTKDEKHPYHVVDKKTTAEKLSPLINMSVETRGFKLILGSIVGIIFMFIFMYNVLILALSPNFNLKFVKNSSISNKIMENIFIVSNRNKDVYKCSKYAIDKINSEDNNKENFSMLNDEIVENIKENELISEDKIAKLEEKNKLIGTKSENKKKTPSDKKDDSDDDDIDDDDNSDDDYIDDSDDDDYIDDSDSDDYIEDDNSDDYDDSDDYYIDDSDDDYSDDDYTEYDEYEEDLQ